MTEARDEIDEFLAGEIDLLADIGARPTGSDAAERLIDHVAAQFGGLGLEVGTDTHHFTRWDLPGPDGLSATVGDRRLTVSAAFPYSGVTGPDGITAPLRHLGGPIPIWPLARDAIAVVELDNKEVRFSDFVDVWEGSEPWPDTRNPLLPATIAGLGLPLARRAGVRAVIVAWRGISPDNARAQYLPFTMDYLDLPVVFVAGQDSNAAVAAARRRESGTIVLDADLVPETPTRSIWATVEGTTDPDEVVLVVSHSDGTNVVEENGHIAMVELARRLTRDPPARTVTFVLATGHLRIPALTPHGQSMTRWLGDHRDLWAGQDGGRRAVAGLAIEHLGAVGYADEGGTYGPTGTAEPEILYATTPEVKALVQAEWWGVTPLRISRPTALIHFGEGEPLYENHIPAVALVTAPQYLLSLVPGDYVDLGLMRRQLDSFGRLLGHFADPSVDLGTVTEASAPDKLRATGRALAGWLRSPRSRR